MAMEQVLYAQDVKLRQKYLKFFATDKKKNEAKFKFQGQSAISQRWFDLDLDWIEVNFITCEPDLYKENFSNDILKNKKINKGEHKVHYSLIKDKQTGTYKILK